MSKFVIVLLIALPLIADPSWDHWTMDAKQAKFERYLGRDSLLLDGGTAWLDDANFEDGVIEFDMAAPATAGFHGLIFRAADHDNFENVYLRSHLSGKPDATQYTPVFNGVSGWQIYASPRFWQQAEIPGDRWMHIRAVLHGQRLELSVDGQTLVYPQLIRKAAPGAIGLTTSLSSAHFANFIMRHGETHPPEGGEGSPADKVPAGSIARWRVSTTFAEKRLDSLDDLDAGQWRDIKWDSLESGVAGIANIAMLRKPERDKNNTVFVATTIRADAAKRVLLRFGYSDRVRVYLNGRPIYRGNDGFQTRDYRYLGTVGLFDELVLPLKRGDNEVWFAVSEDFGGWAVTAALP